MMKKLFIPLFLFLLLAGMGLAQSPEAVNYQAVARDGSGLLMANSALDVRIGIYSGAGGAVLAYEESHSVSTNQFGLFSLKIGEGTSLSGVFANINWADDEHHMKVEVDDGSGYVDLGMSQLVTVPYAFHAKNAIKATDMGLNELNDVTASSPTFGQVLAWDGLSWGPASDQSGEWIKTGNNLYYDQGYVGIGTSTPDQPLSIHTASGISYIRVSDNTSGPTSGLRMGLSGSGNAYIINDESAKSLSLGTDGTSHLRISDIGRVGINELTPDMMLHVKQDAANKGIRIEHQSTTDYWDNGIGTTTKNYKFYYNNLFRADISSVDGSYTQSSDKRLKREIEYMGAVLGRVAQLKPATYHYIDNKEGDPRSTGFVAQEVAEVFPNLVRDMEDGYKGVVYDGFAVISIKAIQELTEKVETLEKEIETLKKAVENK